MLDVGSEVKLYQVGIWPWWSFLKVKKRFWPFQHHWPMGREAMGSLIYEKVWRPNKNRHCCNGKGTKNMMLLGVLSFMSIEHLIITSWTKKDVCYILTWMSVSFFYLFYFRMDMVGIRTFFGLEATPGRSCRDMKKSTYHTTSYVGIIINRYKDPY